MLKIGCGSNKLALWQAVYTRTQLLEIGVESEIVAIQTREDQGGGDENLTIKAVEDALLRGETDVAVQTMRCLSTTQAPGLVITAVSERGNPADVLLIRPDAINDKHLFRLKEGARIGTASMRCKAQFRQFRPDVHTVELNGDALAGLDLLRAGKCDAIFLAAAEIAWLSPDLHDLVLVELHPQEFAPAPAQGVIAWQANQDDTATRLIFQNLHETAVSACTNVERRVLLILGDIPSLGVYCMRDNGGNYHVYAAGEIDGKWRTARLSSTTSVGVADRVVAMLKDS